LTDAVAVVGCGYWGKNLVRVLSQLGALRCVCDTDATRFPTLAIQGNPPKYTNKLADVPDFALMAAVGILCYGLGSGMFAQTLCVRQYTLMLFAYSVAL